MARFLIDANLPYRFELELPLFTGQFPSLEKMARMS